MNLRPYQESALVSINDRYKAGVNDQLVHWATGLGKTVLFSQLPKTFTPRRSEQERHLVLAHRDELVTQGVNTIKRWNPDMKVGREMAGSYASASDDIVVASVATIGRVGAKRLHSLNPSEFATMTTDEAHRSAAASYGRVFEHMKQNPDLLNLGVTATPNRTDGVGLKAHYKEIVSSMPLLRSIEEGWLVDLVGYKVYSNTKLDNVSVTAGEFNAAELGDVVDDLPRYQLAVDAYLKHGEGRKALVFVPLVKNAVTQAKVFRAMGIHAEAVWGSDPDRVEKLAAHKRGDFKVIINSDLLTEGYDDWEVGCIINAKPLKSALRYEQIIGRGTRLPKGRSSAGARGFECRGVGFGVGAFELRQVADKFRFEGSQAGVVALGSDVLEEFGDAAR